jgi:hypothetical protein
MKEKQRKRRTDNKKTTEEERRKKKKPEHLSVHNEQQQQHKATTTTTTKKRTFQLLQFVTIRWFLIWLSNTLGFPVLVAVQACATFLVCPGCLELLSADRRPIGRNNDGFFQSVRSCPVPLFVFVPISWLCESLLVVGWAAADGRPLLNQCPLVLGIPRLLCSWPTVWTARVGWPTIVCAVQLKHRKMKMGFVLIV